MKKHEYKVSVQWTGNTGKGTQSYRSYERNHIISVNGKPEIPGSSDPSFRGDASRYSPEDLFVASLSSCHMLWVLHFSSAAGIVITAYEDRAEATMLETEDGNGHFEEVILRPLITIAGTPTVERLNEIQSKAHEFCFIANSCNFPVRHQAEYIFES